MKKNSLLTILILYTISAQAVTITWDGGGDGTSWDDPVNWFPNGVPCVGCDVEITSVSNTVVLKTAESIKSLYIKDSRLEITGTGILEIDNASGGDALALESAAEIFVNNGIIDIDKAASNGINIISGLIDIAGTGSVKVNGALGNGLEISSAGILNILNASSKLKITAAGDHVIENDGILFNQGIITLTSDNNGIRNNGTFTNNSFLTNTYNGVGLKTGFFNTSSGVFLSSSSSDIEIIDFSIGIWNYGGFTQIGDLEITGSTSNGIRNDDTFSCQGTITIIHSTGQSIENRDSFTNTGTIDITNTGSNNAVKNLLLGSTFYNNGSLTVNNTGGPCLLNDHQYSTFSENASGSFTCNNGYIYNFGIINLQGTNSISTLPLTGPKGSHAVRQITASSGDEGMTFYLSGSLSINNFETGIRNWAIDAEFETGPGSTTSMFRVDRGIDNRKKFWNSGLMEFDKMEEQAILSDGNFRNFSTGSIIVDSVITSSTALVLPVLRLIGDIINEGNIEIKDKSMPSIYQTGGFFDNYGIIKLEGAVGNFENLRNATIVNTAEIHTTKLDVWNNIENDGLLKVRGEIKADTIKNEGTIDLKYSGIRNTVLHNLAGGLIMVDSADYQGSTLLSGAIAIGEELINEGTIKITNAPQSGLLYVATDSLINKGVIDIDSCEYGIVQAGSASISNHTGAEIKVKMAFSYGIQFENSFHNAGLIEIDSSIAAIRKQGFVAVSAFDNYGSINLTNIVGIGFDQLRSLNNYATGSIVITGGSGSNVNHLTNHGTMSFSNGLSGFIAAKMDNYGNISGSNLSSGIGLSLGNDVSNGIPATNHPTGIIFFDSVIIGIKSQPTVNTSPTFVNYGEIAVENIETGIEINVAENFGEITIDEASVSGLVIFYNRPTGTIYLYNAPSSSIITNEGEIYLDNSLSAIAINAACGFVESNTGFVGSTENYGFIRFSEDNINNINITNHSFIQNLKGIRKANNWISSNGFENFGLQVGYINGTPSVGVNELNVIRVDPAFNSGVNTLYTSYTNPIVNTVGGTFNFSTNAVVLNAAGANATTLYAPISYGPSCTVNLEIPIVQSGPCSSITVAETIEPYGFPNREWHIPENWSDAEVPGPCTKVVISKRVTIPTSAKARAHSVDTSNSNFIGPLHVNTGSVLEVDPSW